jgi:PPOX class probable F420-dependent enzyme
VSPQQDLVPFADLFKKLSYGHVATLMADGSPQVTPVWTDYDGTYLLVNTAVGRVKDRNMRLRNRVAIEVMDPDNWQRYVTVRGVVAAVVEGEEAEAHIDSLAARYLNVPRYQWRAPGERRVLFKITPQRVSGVNPSGFA